MGDSSLRSWWRGGWVSGTRSPCHPATPTPRHPSLITPSPNVPVTPVMTRVTGVVRSDKAIDRPRRATDEEPVDIRQRSERAGVAWVDAAAVENWNLGARAREEIVATGSDQVGDRFDVIRTGWRAAGADRPDRLIGNLNESQLLRSNSVQADPQLPLDCFTANAVRSFFGCL